MMDTIKIKNKEGHVVRTMYTQQWASPKIAAAFARGLADYSKEECTIEYRVTPSTKRQ